MADPKVNILITATDKTKGVLGGIGNALGNLGKIALGVAVGGIAAVGAGLAFSIKEAIEAQEVDAKLAAVLKATGGAAGVTAEMANDYANSLTKVTRFSDETIKSAETVLLRFKSIGKDVFPQATKITLDLATAMGTDASQAAVMLGKALETPGEGLLRLKAAGVALSDEQIDLIQKMAETGDMAGAQKMIMDELTKSVGGMAEASGSTFAGKLDIFKNALGNIGEAIGMKVLPLLQPLVDSLGKMANALLTAGLFSDEFRNALASMVGDENAAQIMVIFQAIYDWLQVNIPIAIQTVSTFWTTVLQPAIAAVWNWMSTVLIPFLVNEVYPWLAVNIPIALQFLSNVWTTVLWPAIQAVWNWMSTVLIPFLVNEVFPWLQTNIPKALQTLSNFWQNVLKPAIMAVWNWMSTVLIPFLQDTVFPWLQENIPKALQTLSDFWTNTLHPAIKTVWEWMTGTLFPTLQDLWDWLSPKLGAVIKTLSELWEQKLWPALKKVWEIITQDVLPKIKELNDFIGNTFHEAVKKVTGIIDGMREAFDRVKSAVQWVIDKIAALINKLKEVKIPGWLQRKSPSEFEMSFIGANEAIKELTGIRLPALSYQLGNMGAPGANRTTTNQFYIQLSGSGQAGADVASTVRLMEMLYG